MIVIVVFAIVRIALLLFVFIRRTMKWKNEELKTTDRNFKEDCEQSDIRSCHIIYPDECCSDSIDRT